MNILYILAGIIAAIILLYFFAVMPRVLNRSDRRPFDKPYFAHRGLHNNKTSAPENSMAAFAMAVEKGYGIELDVQLTKDNIPVVFHDYKLKRVCKTDKLIKELTYKEIEKLHLFQSREKIPKFEEVLLLVGGQVPLIVEFKVEWEAKATCEKADGLLQRYKGVYCIESFSPLALLWYKKHRPHVMRGQLASNFLKEKKEGSKLQYFILDNLLLNFLGRPDFIAYDYHYKNKLSFRLVTKLFHALAFAWTIKSQEALEENTGEFNYFIFDSFIPKFKVKK